MLLIPVLIESDVRPLPKLAGALSTAAVTAFHGRINPRDPAAVIPPMIAANDAGALEVEALDIAGATAIAEIAGKGRMVSERPSGTRRLSIRDRLKLLAPGLFAPEARRLPGSCAWDLCVLKTLTAAIPVTQTDWRAPFEPATLLEEDRAARLEAALAAMGLAPHNLPGTVLVPLFVHPADLVTAHERMTWVYRLKRDADRVGAILSGLGFSVLTVVDLRPGDPLAGGLQIGA